MWVRVYSQSGEQAKLRQPAEPEELGLAARKEV